MFNANKDFSLSNLIDINFLQELQDNFADTIGIAVLIVDKNGSVTKPSNINTNNAELNHFVVPIIVGNNHIASILGGEISAEYIQGLKGIKIVPKKSTKKFIKLISLVTNSISEIANKSHELIKKNQREEILIGITNKIRNSLNLEEIKHEIVNLVGNFFEADKVVVTYYDDKVKDYIVTEKAEYLSTDKTKSGIGIIFKDIPGFDEYIKNIHLKGEDIIFSNLEEHLDKNNLRGTAIENFYRDFEIIASAVINIYYKKQFLGNIILSFTHIKDFSDDEINFLKSIADQAGIAFHQAELYSKTKQQAQREMLLREITETIRNSLDFNKTKRTIVEIIGKTLGVDRCFIAEYNKFSDKFLIVDEEYLSSNDLISFKGIDLNENSPVVAAEFKKGKYLIIDETGVQLGEEKIDLNDSRFVIEKETQQNFCINSALIFPLFYREDFLGNLVLHWTKVQHKIDEDEINFLSLILNQIVLALHQAKLYERIQLQAEREKISRNIIEIMRSTLDKNIIKKLFVKNIGKFFNANRVFMCDYDVHNKTFLSVDENSEFLSNKELKSFIGIEEIREIFKQEVKMLVEKREVLIPSIEEYKKDNKRTQEQLDLVESGEIKSAYSFPITYQDKLVGVLSIDFTSKQTELSYEDINRIRSICTQAGIALYHAGLYQEAQEALQTKSNIIKKVKNGVEPTVNIIVHGLDNILNSCHELMELTKDISKENNP